MEKEAKRNEQFKPEEAIGEPAKPQYKVKPNLPVKEPETEDEAPEKE